MKKDYYKETLEEVVKKSHSYSEVLLNLGKEAKGSNFKTVKKYVLQYGIDTSHFDSGAAKRTKSNTTNLEDVLSNKIYLGSDSLKKRLIEAGLKQYECEICHCHDWNGLPLVLELHHINGNHYDNTLENLQILCPNCHSQTENHRGKNGRNKGERYTQTRKELAHLEDKECLYCHKVFFPDRANRAFCCRECYIAYQEERQERIHITKDALEKEVTECKTITELAKKFNTSRPTIHKYLEEYGLLDEMKYKYDFHAKEIEQYDFDGNLIKIWPSITDAETTLKISSISKCLNHSRKSTGGFVWRYKEKK